MSQKLYTLIQSLNKSEKSYFKKFAHKSSFSKSSIYYKLFDEIATQKKYDELKIVKKFEQNFDVKQLSAAKSYLMTLIIDCFCVYNRKKKVLSKIHHKIERIEFLRGKKLYSQALAALEKVLIEALKLELFPYVMQLQYIKEKIIKSQDDIKRMIEYNDIGFEAEFKAIEQWKNFREYSLMTNTFFTIEFNQSLTRVSDETIKLNDLITSDLYSDEKNALSLLAKTTRAHALSYGSNILGSTEAAYLAKKQNVVLFQQNVDFQKAYPLKYISGLSNLVVAEIFRYNKENTILCIEALEKIKPQTFEESIFRDNILISAWLLHYSVHQISITVLKELNELSNRFQSISNYMTANNVSEILFLLAYNYFIAKDYSSTIQWAEYFEKNIKKDTSLEFWLGIKLINLIAHFEKGYNFYIEYTGDSTYRFIKKRGKIYQTELALILFLKKMINLPEREINKTHFQKFKLKIKNSMGGDSCVYGLFDLIGWIDNKIFELS